MKRGQRILSFILVLGLCVSMLPVNALAEEKTILAGEELLTLVEEAVEEADAPEEKEVSEETEESVVAEAPEETFAQEETEEPVETIVPESTEQPVESPVAEIEQESETLLAVSGTCGDNLTWMLDDEGVLTISGTGGMNNYSYYYYHVPWAEDRSYITTVIIENGVTSIGQNAFYDCDSLTSVTIPDSVTTIGVSAFGYCDSLTTINVGDKCTAYADIDGVLFNKACTELICCPGGKSGTYTIPDSVTTIGDYAFWGCDSLTSVTIPDSVTTIGSYAFGDCASLTSVTIGDSVTSIGMGAFFNCTSLTSMDIPDSVTTIGVSAFVSCDSLTTINVGDKCTAYADIDGVLFNKACTELICCPGGKSGTYTIPDSVTTIGDYAFWGCDSLTSVTIPDSVTTIGDYAFEGCTSLTSVTIGTGLTTIRSRAFTFCDSLADVYYTGTEEQWSGIDIYDGNECLTDATIHYEYDPSIDTSYLTGSPASGEVAIRYHISKYGVEDNAKLGSKTIGTVQIQYSDSYFSKAATVYNHDLAQISLGATMAATTVDLDENYKDGLVENGDQYIRYFLTGIGCDEDAIVTSGFDNNKKIDDQCAYAIGVKKLPDSDYYLMPVIIRSNGYGGEWVSNMNVYSSEAAYASYAKGFKSASEHAYAGVKAYLEELEALGIPSSQVKLWVCGFSRGGAIANLLGASLTADVKNDIGIASENIFVYTFATPTTVKSGREEDYSNIFNIVSEIDAVPRLPLSSWGFVHHGITKYLPAHTTSGKNYGTLLANMQKEFNSIADSVGIGDCTNKPYYDQEKVLDLLIDYLDDPIDSVETYGTAGYQDLMKDIMAAEYVDLNAEAVIMHIVAFVAPETTELIKEMVMNWEDWGIVKRQIKMEQLKLMLVCSGFEAVEGPVGGLGRMLLQLVVNHSARLMVDASGGLITALLLDSSRYYNTMVKMLVHVFTDGFSSPLLVQHWPESYLAWLRSGSSDVLYSEDAHKVVCLKCPVDVYVYDSAGNMVVKVEDDIRDTDIENGLYVYVDEFGEKTVYIPEDDEYTIEVVAREDCTVTVSNQHFDEEEVLQETECWLDIPVEESGALTADALIGDFVVEQEGEVLPADITATGEQLVEITASCGENGVIAGAGSYDLGDTVVLSAAANTGYRLEGWYCGDELVSTDVAYNFTATENKTFEARFCERPLGDVNASGEIDVFDLVRLMKYLVGAEEDVLEVECDMNGDNTIDILDVICLVKTLA